MSNHRTRLLAALIASLSGLPTAALAQRPANIIASELIKWETPAWAFGHLWLAPREGRAGWWTRGEGGEERREFESVEPDVSWSTWRLRYPGGSVAVRIAGATGDASMTWTRPPEPERTFEGRRENGIYIDAVLAPSPWLSLPRRVRDALAGPLERSVDRTYARWLADEFASWRACPAAGTDVTWARFFFDWVLDVEARKKGLGSGRDARFALVALQAKLAAESLWEAVEVIDRADDGAAILFVPVGGHDALRRRLFATGTYGDWFGASHARHWGARSAKVGAQLHIRGPGLDAAPDDQVVNVHIDLKNPGRPSLGIGDPVLPQVVRAVEHRRHDLDCRSETHTPDNVSRALAAQGIDIPYTE